MKLNQLRDLVAIVERGSLRGAARHLDVAQSGLTRSIRNLERELGHPMFERDARGMVLTPIYQLFDAIMTEKKEKFEKMLTALGVTLNAADRELAGKQLLKRTMQKWLPLA